MGLLDDAIREHLELKRRRGADPGEVARQENEALGETRRAEFARPDTAEQPASVRLDEPAEEMGEEPAAELRDEPGAEIRDEPVAEAEEPLDAGDEREPFDIEAAEAPTTIAEPPPAPDPWRDDERDEVPAEEALDRPRDPEPQGDPAREDVLEETPDFLQETPEHDRLWFEQRPPRDFDWDK
jgi:hypothetical protein